MHTVLNAARLIVLVGLGLAYFLGQGWLVVGPLAHGSLTRKKRDIPLLQELPLMLLVGLILNFGIVLGLQSLSASLLVGGILCILGAWGFLLSTFRKSAWRMPSPAALKPWVGAAFLCALFLAPILAEPLIDWDARSIWFLHAKMIYTAGSIGPSAQWLHPSVAFSHVDYPMLVPALAAQVAHGMGFWNEVLPKMALLWMLIPASIWLFSFARRSFSFAVLLLLIPFAFSKWIWNGYMDGFLALYFSIAVLLLGRYVQSSQPIDLISSISCFLLLLSIKNEGALAALAGLGAIFLVLLLKKTSFAVKSALPLPWKYILSAAIGLGPLILWTVDKQQWNINNYLEIGTAQSFLRILSRLQDGSYTLILQNSYPQIEAALLLLGLVVFASAVMKKSIAKESLPALIAAGLYGLGIWSIYLMTPLDLAWQLKTSIDRTLLSVNGCLFIACYYILNGVENSYLSAPRWLSSLRQHKDPG